MERAFWDSSSLVPLCVQQAATRKGRVLSARYSIAVWWGTPVELQSAFARLLRTGEITSNGQVQAQVFLDLLRRDWQEIAPSEQLRDRAGFLVARFSLSAADAFQLAAAWIWCLGRPRNRPFISGDLQLLDAARQLGFKAVET